jgi:hypothetical protein
MNHNVLSELEKLRLNLSTQSLQSYFDLIMRIFLVKKVIRYHKC